MVELDTQYGEAGNDDSLGDANIVSGTATVNGGIDTQYGGTEADYTLR